MLGDGHDGRDTAPTAQAHHRALGLPGAEDPGRLGHRNGVAFREPVEEPVGHQPAGHPLHGDGEVGVRLGCARHGVRPELLVAVDVNPERAELARPIAESLGQLGGDVQHEGRGIVRLGDDLLDPQRVVAVVAQHGVVVVHGVGQATDFISRYWSNPATPFCRPMPLSL